MKNLSLFFFSYHLIQFFEGGKKQILEYYEFIDSRKIFIRDDVETLSEGRIYDRL